LAGKLLNTSRELSSSGIASEIFKTVITGEPIPGKLLWRNTIEFRPQAQHVFATNKLPPFVGGIDSGVKRRLLVVVCSRVIPEEEMVEYIAAKIRDEEYSLLLSFAVEGARRLIEQKKFTQPPSSDEALTKWINDTDPVKAWMEECVRADPGNVEGYQPKDAAAYFRNWAKDNFYDEKDYKKTHVDALRDRMLPVYPSVRRTAESRNFRGIQIVAQDQSDLEGMQRLHKMATAGNGTGSTKSVH
jgi:phage/plasmid-associated DNA primase